MKKHVCMYSFCIPEIYQIFSFLIRQNHPHITYSFCEIKTMLIMEKTEGGSMNLCTPSCLFVKCEKR